MNYQDRMNTDAAARYIGKSKKTLEKLRCIGSPIPYYKIGHSVFYLRTDLDAYLARCRRGGEAQAA